MGVGEPRPRAFSRLVRCLLRVCLDLLASVFLLVFPKKRKPVGDDVVLITGGGRGLGRSIALEFAKHRPKNVGDRLQIILWGRNVEALSKTTDDVKCLGTPCTYMRCDVSNREEIYKMAEETRKGNSPVTILVNNAGVIYGKQILESRDEDVEMTFRVNALAHFWTLKSFLPSMQKNKHGHVVTIGSCLGLIGLRGAADYSSSKYAVTGLSESLFAYTESGEFPGVHATVVYPYQINNEMFDGCTPRFPSLFPPIDEQFVAKKTVDAVLTNTKTLILPWHFSIIIWMASWMPSPVILLINQFFGVDRAMDSFRGHQGTAS